MPYRQSVTAAQATRAAGWAEFAGRETRREKARVERGDPSPEELGRRDAEVHFEDQEAFRRDLETIKSLEETDMNRIWHRRHPKVKG